MVGIRDRATLPSQAGPVADKIDRLGFKWTFDYEYPVADPSSVQRLQIRDDQHNAPTRDVHTYAQAMKRGDKFPPGVVTADGRFVDFNTRATAAHKLGWPTFPVFILNVNYETASSTDRERLWLLGASFNSYHGNRLTRDELAHAIRQVADNQDDWTAERVAALLGVTRATVQNMFAQVRAEKRAKRLGLDLSNGSITASGRTVLGQRDDKFTDAPWRAIAKLVQDAGLTHKEVSDLCTRIAKIQEGPDAQLAAIESEQTAREGQISHHLATGKVRPPKSSELKSRLGWLNNYTGKVGELIDYNPGSAGDYLETLHVAYEILGEVISQQDQVVEEIRAA